MSTDCISSNLSHILKSVRDQAESVNRHADSVRVIAVSKTVGADKIMEAFDCGQAVFGENRPQELYEKSQSLPASIEWHMIGHLQSNKVRKAVGSSDLIHSIDSVKLLNRINDAGRELQKVQCVLLQVNVSGEESKFGIPVEDVERIASNLGDLPNIRCRGLMTMAPYGASEDELHRVFSGLRELRDRIQETMDLPLPELSMGMSSDYRIAIAEGATLVRIGTAIFGTRKGTNGV